MFVPGVRSEFFRELRKSFLQGGQGGSDFDDLDCIEENLPQGKLIISTKIKKIIIHSCPDIIQFLQFTYQIETKEGILEIDGNEVGTRNNGQNHWWGKCEKVEEVILDEEETISGMGGSFSPRFAGPILGGLRIKTSLGKVYEFGCSLKGKSDFDWEVSSDMVVYGNHGDLVDGLGIYRKESQEDIVYWPSYKDKDNKGEPYSLKKSNLEGQGYDWGNSFDDLEKIKSQVSNSVLIKSIRVKGIIVGGVISSNPVVSPIIKYLNFIYWVATDQSVLEIKGHKIGEKESTDGIDLSEEIVILNDDESVIEFGGSFSPNYSNKILSGLRIKTSKGNVHDLFLSLGGLSDFNFAIEGDFVIFGQADKVIHGIGFYSNDFIESKRISYCSNCKKRMLKEKAPLLNKERKLFFCSSDCQEKWEREHIAQSFLEAMHPRLEGLKERSKVIEIKISNQGLMGALDLSDFINLEKLDCSHNEITSLIIPKSQNLQILDCSFNKINSLDVSGCQELKELFCKANKISTLELTNNKKLKKVNCSENLLTVLEINQRVDLEELDVSKNKFKSQNPSWLSNLTILKYLNLSDNKFIGSLEFVKNIGKLETLDICGNNFDLELEYLPISLKNLNFDESEKLKFYDDNLILWKSVHFDLMKKVNGNPIVIDYSDANPIKLIGLPNFLQQSEGITQINYCFDFNYSSFLLCDGRPFNWSDMKEVSSPKLLPVKLYHFPGNQVVDSELVPVNSNYAILSYVWGNLADKDNLTTWDYTQQDKNQNVINKQIGVNIEHKATGTTRESIKALKKSKSAVEFLNKKHNASIDYLWMDQLCIDQFDDNEKGREVPKMRQYYDQSDITLVAIDAEIGEISEYSESWLIEKTLRIIINSSWFKRSWTFQEGLLSRQTIFMFDDALVDGRLLALAWGSWRKEYNGQRIKSSFQIFITPLGWSYGSYLKQDFKLNIGEALLAVKHRSQSVPIDGFYAVLGLLPYGHLVEVKYQPWGHRYSREELEYALQKILQVAIEKGYGQEVFSWVGVRRCDCWYSPQVEKNGSTNVKDLNKYSFVKNETFSDGIFLEEGEVYQVDGLFSDGFGIGFWCNWKTFRIDQYSVSEADKNKIEVGDVLIVISKKGNQRLAISMSKLINKSICLLEFSSWENYFQNIWVNLENREIVYGQVDIDLYRELSKTGNIEKAKKLLEWNKWKYIHKEFDEELVQNWQEKNFDYQEVYQWRKTFKDCFSPFDIAFYIWLKDVKNLKFDDCSDEYAKEQSSTYFQVKKSRDEFRKGLLEEFEKEKEVLEILQVQEII